MSGKPVILHRHLVVILACWLNNLFCI